MNDSLAVAEKSALAMYEDSIRRGMGTFVEVGRALQAIRDGRLYRALHPTFEAYCKDRWGFARAYANRLIESSETDEAVAPIGAKPANEAQSRPLNALPKTQRAGAWRKAVETAVNGKVTAKHVQKVVDGIIERPTRKGVSPRLRVDVVLANAIETIDTAVYALERVADQLSEVSPEMSKRFRDVRARFIRLVRAMGDTNAEN